MFVVLYGLALAMAAAGAYAAFAGWEFLLLERGWSMVIAGSTLATGGLVLGGLAAAAQALAKRLDALGDALRSSPRVQQPVFPKRPVPPEAGGEPAARPAPAPKPPDREIEPRIPPQSPPKAPPREPVSPAGPAPVAALGIGGAAAEAIAPEASHPPPEPEEGLQPIDPGKMPGGEEREPPPVGETAAEPVEGAVEAAATAQPAEEPPEPEQLRQPVAEDAADALEAPEPEGELPGAAAVAGPGIEEPVTGRRERGRIEAEAEALARRFQETSVPFGAGPRADVETAEEFAAPEAEPEPEPEPEPRAGPETDEALERLAATAAEPAPPREPSHALEEAAGEAQPADAPGREDAEIGESPDEAGAQPPEPPVVVGTHLSGANRYVMYSDGSIEAETPDGRLVFGSIDELKGFIASGGEDPSGASQTGPR